MNRPISRRKASELYYAQAKKRSRRSVIQDVNRRRGKPLRAGSPKSHLYALPGGTLRYDFKGVDDGSPKAKRALRRFLKSPKAQLRRDRLPSRLQPTRNKIEPEFTQKLQGGTQSEIYLDPVHNLIQKEFKSDPEKQVMEQSKFLQENRTSGVVPKFWDADPKEGIIQMEYLQGYEELAKELPSIKKQGQVENLLKSLDSARRKLRTDKWYEDLSNLRNILIKPDQTKPFGFDVKFVEGGRASRLGNVDKSVYVNAWLKEVIDRMRVRNNPLAKAIYNDMPWP